MRTTSTTQRPSAEEWHRATSDIQDAPARPTPLPPRPQPTQPEPQNSINLPQLPPLRITRLTYWIWLLFITFIAFLPSQDGILNPVLTPFIFLALYIPIAALRLRHIQRPWWLSSTVLVPIIGIAFLFWLGLTTSSTGGKKPILIASAFLTLSLILLLLIPIVLPDNSAEPPASQATPRPPIQSPGSGDSVLPTITLAPLMTNPLEGIPALSEHYEECNGKYEHSDQTARKQDFANKIKSGITLRQLQQFVADECPLPATLNPNIPSSPQTR